MKTPRTTLPRAEARIGVLYVERGRVARKSHALVFRRKDCYE